MLQYKELRVKDLFKFAGTKWKINNYLHFYEYNKEPYRVAM